MTQIDQHPRAVLITGASTGIGYACALELDRRKFHVFAGVRTEEAGERLRKDASSLLTPVMIDVVDAASIAAAAASIKEQVGDRGLAAREKTRASAFRVHWSWCPSRTFAASWK
jgi:NAD(P)-dependent dehydrogenase (short-subunit alcohol dehydrogenase family)